MSEIDCVSLAEELLSALDEARFVPPPTERYPDVDFGTAYAVAREATRLREARGERPIGRKIGYTNRAMWAQFNVHQPIWGTMYAHTVQEARDGSASLSIAAMVAPRIEPEIAFRLSDTPPAACDDPATILGCVEWVARSFEVVDCHYAGWKFSGPDSVVDFGHHAALVIGEPRRVHAGDASNLVDALRTCRVTLTRNGEVVDSGTGANALGHPARALARLVDVIVAQTDAPPLERGEIITTGTLTMAPFVQAGETWRTETHGLDLPPLSVSL